MFFPSIGIFIMPAVVYSCYQKCCKFLCTFNGTAPFECLSQMGQLFCGGVVCCRYNESFSFACLSHFNGLDNVCLCLGTVPLMAVLLVLQIPVH